MANVFTYGATGGRPVAASGKGWLPGQITSRLGLNHIVPAVREDNDIEFGEVVVLSGGGQDAMAYKASRPEDAAATAFFGVVRRDEVGAPTINPGIITKPHDNVPSSVFIGGSRATICVPLQDGATQSPAIGATPRVGIKDGVFIGGVYAAAVVVETVDQTVVMTDWEVAETKFQPTSSSGYCILIRKKV